MDQSAATGGNSYVEGKNGTCNLGGLRRLGILISVVTALVSWFFLWQNRFGGFFLSFLAFSLLLIVLFKPLLLNGLHRFWVKVAEIPGRILTNFLLTLFFFCVCTPVGMAVRLLKIDLLGIKMPKNGSSYWDKGPGSYWVAKKKKRGRRHL